MGAPKSVEQFLDGLDAPTRATVDRLRQLIRESREGLGEHIKWNAPSFCCGGDDRITLGLDPKGGVRVILHRGAKVKDASGFRFEDRSGLVRWAAPDRGVLTFADQAAVDAHDEALRGLFGRWIDATR